MHDQITGPDNYRFNDYIFIVLNCEELNIEVSSKKI